MSEPSIEDVRALYADPPDRFVEARKELVARLKAEGDEEAAKAAAKLRKPTVAAWAVDRLARDAPGDLEALLGAGGALQAAQRKAAGGGGAEDLQRVGRERRRLVDGLTEAAGKALEGAGLGAARATLDKVTNTLMALATDAAAADRVRRGILDKELPAPAGFGDERLDAMLLASVTELPRRSGGADAATAATDRKQLQARQRAERLAADADAAEREAERLERDAKRAEAEAAKVRRSANDARARAERARGRAREAADRIG